MFRVVLSGDFVEEVIGGDAGRLMLKLEAGLLGVVFVEDGIACEALGDLFVAIGELSDLVGEEDLETVRIGECIWSDSEMSSKLLL